MAYMEVGTPLLYKSVSAIASYSLPQSPLRTLPLLPNKQLHVNRIVPRLVRMLLFKLANNKSTIRCGGFGLVKVLQ